MKIKIISFIMAVLLSAIYITGCGNSLLGEQKEENTSGNIGKTEESVADVFAMDTYMTIRAYGADEAELSEVTDRIKELDSLWSVTNAESEIYKINHDGSGMISDETETLLNGALKICDETDGALDISIYPIVHEWGFTTGDYKVPDDEVIKRELELVNYKNIDIERGDDEKRAVVSLASGMEIDPGSVGKGYTGDVITAMLKKMGVESALLDLGGNIHTLGAKPDGSPWIIGIQRPEGEGYFATLKVNDKAVITSGGYERFFIDDDGNMRWHIIDPETGYPAKNGLISVTIISDRGLYSDGLSTALFVKGKDGAIDFWKEHKDFDMILITEDDRLIITEGIEDELTVEADAGFSSEEIVHIN